jgi:hypothetical protein
MHILFGKRRSAKDPPKSSPVLAPSFAQELIFLEEQLNLNCTLQTVTRLLELYRKAIEHYEAEKNLTHIHYQERMQSLLSRTNVVQLFKSTHQPMPEAKSPAPLSPRTKPQSDEKRQNSDLVVERNCEKVLKELTIESSQLYRKLQDNLKLQSEGLSQRILDRKHAQTPRVKTRFVFEETNQCDISAGEAKKNPVEEFECEVEGIIEKFVEEKNIAKERVKNKYSEFFEETNAIRGEMREKLRKELVRNMEKEIEECIIEIDERRNEEIAAARTKLNSTSFYKHY